MKFLLHSADGTYSSADEKYNFVFSRRHDKQRRLKIAHSSYTAPSTLTPLPHVIYMRSQAISELSRSSDMKTLHGSKQEASSDVCAVLFETHEKGRYKQQEKVVFDLNKHKIINNLDIYFSNADTVISSQTGSSSSSSSSSGVSDQDILNLSDLLFFVDWDYTSNITPANITQDDDITSITSRKDGTYVFNTSVASGLTYKSFGQTNSMLSSVNWHYALDLGTGNLSEGNEATLTMMFRTKTAPLTSWNWIFKSALFQISTGEALSSANHMGYYDADLSLFGYTSLVIAGDTDYFLQIRKSSNTFEWELIDLATDVVQTESTSDTAATGTANIPVYISNAQTGMQNMKISHIIEVLNTTAADCLAVKNWMLQKYTGENVQEEEEETGTNANFFTELTLT